jgi:RNA polymerase-binding transcription factor DksA
VTTDEFNYNNEEEAEMAQLHSIHINMNAVAEVQRALMAQAAQASATECEDCGDEIPQERQQAIRGVQRCTHCQTLFERRRAGY